MWAVIYQWFITRLQQLYCQCTGLESLQSCTKPSIPREQDSWGQHGSHLSPVGPRRAPCWPHEPCCQGMFVPVPMKQSWHVLTREPQEEINHTTKTNIVQQSCVHISSNVTRKYTKIGSTESLMPIKLGKPGCMSRIVDIEALLLKHQTISIHSAAAFCVGWLSYLNIIFLGNNLRKYHINLKVNSPVV